MADAAPRTAAPSAAGTPPERRNRFEHLGMIGWAQPGQAVKIVNWCGHGQEFVAWPEADGE